MLYKNIYAIMMTHTIDDLNNLKIKKYFYNGKNAKSVVLLENDIIKKTYPSTKTKEFYKELKILKKLKDYEHSTQLINYDKSNLVIWETYCGVKPTRTKKNLNIIHNISKYIHKKYDIVRIVDKKLSYIPHFGNIGILNGIIRFFDFGGKNWKILDTL